MNPSPHLANSPAAPWHRLPDETHRSFEAFTLYRDAGPSRSVRSTWVADRQRRANRGHTLQPTRGRHLPGYLGRWASLNRWRERAAAWDTHVADTAAAGRLPDLLVARQRVAATEWTVARALFAHAGRLLDDPRQLAAVDTRALTRLLLTASTLGRRATGMPIAHVQAKALDEVNAALPSADAVADMACEMLGRVPATARRKRGRPTP